MAQLNLDGDTAAVTVDPNVRAARRSTGPEDGRRLAMVPRLSRIPKIGVEIPDEVAAAFKQALKIRDHREYQIADSKHCLGVGLCEVCDEYEGLVAVVNAALKVKPGIVPARRYRRAGPADVEG